MTHISGQNLRATSSSYSLIEQVEVKSSQCHSGSFLNATAQMQCSWPRVVEHFAQVQYTCHFDPTLQSLRALWSQLNILARSCACTVPGFNQAASAASNSPAKIFTISQRHSLRNNELIAANTASWRSRTNSLDFGSAHDCGKFRHEETLAKTYFPTLQSRSRVTPAVCRPLTGLANLVPLCGICQSKKRLAYPIVMRVCNPCATACEP